MRVFWPRIIQELDTTIYVLFSRNRCRSFVRDFTWAFLQKFSYFHPAFVCMCEGTESHSDSLVEPFIQLIFERRKTLESFLWPFYLKIYPNSLTPMVDTCTALDIYKQCEELESSCHVWQLTVGGIYVRSYGLLPRGSWNDVVAAASYSWVWGVYMMADLDRSGYYDLMWVLCGILVEIFNYSPTISSIQ